MNTKKSSLFNKSNISFLCNSIRIYFCIDKYKLSKLKTICSTGSPLSDEGFEYVYKNIKKNVHLASISGGTDIVSCFVLGNIYSPVLKGEIQNNGLGMDVDVFSVGGKFVFILSPFKSFI